MENGDTDLASKEKHRLEEAQRARRKVLEKSGKEYCSAYFRQEAHPLTGELVWKFNGKYWKDRAAGDWSSLVRIFD